MENTSLDTRVAALNQAFGDASAQDILRGALTSPDTGRTALVSSFGADSVVLLHMAAQLDKSLPVIFLNTELLFVETLQYQSDLVNMLGLWNVRIVRPDEHELAARDPESVLHMTNPDLCCALRKTRPLHRALDGFGSWITGRKRFQADTRTSLSAFESEPTTGRIKINPLARWSRADIQTYITAHNLPKHPLVAKGYPSIGCFPCTSAVAPGEDDRAGRWRGQAKTECGIHFGEAGLIRKGVSP